MVLTKLNIFTGNVISNFEDINLSPEVIDKFVNIHVFDFQCIKINKVTGFLHVLDLRRIHRKQGEENEFK